MLRITTFSVHEKLSQGPVKDIRNHGFQLSVVSVKYPWLLRTREFHEPLVTVKKDQPRLQDVSQGYVSFDYAY